MPSGPHSVILDVMGRLVGQSYAEVAVGQAHNGGDVFVYHRDTHPQLDPKLHILENHGLISDNTYNNVDRYRLTEEFVKYLTREEKP